MDEGAENVKDYFPRILLVQALTCGQYIRDSNWELPVQEPKEEEEVAARQKASDEFAVARANAINTYAELEMHLALLFQQLLGAETQRSFTVFGAILNSQARLKVISKLLRLSFGEQFEVFFTSLAHKLAGIDSTRNKIAHWIVLHSRTGGKPFDPKKDIALHAHPDVFARSKLYKHEIVYFQKQAQFYSLLVHQFSVCVNFPEAMDIGDPNKKSWRKIFGEEVSFPPEENHPLHKP